jgi:hypothetical protein
MTPIGCSIDEFFIGRSHVTGVLVGVRAENLEKRLFCLQIA